MDYSLFMDGGQQVVVNIMLVCFTSLSSIHDSHPPNHKNEDCPCPDVFANEVICKKKRGL